MFFEIGTRRSTAITPDDVNLIVEPHIRQSAPYKTVKAQI